MFPKNQRVTKKKDFDLIFKKGKVYHSPIFSIRILENDSGVQRFAVLVSKKVSNKAVDRNKTKRIIREAVKQNTKLFPSSSDSVIYTHPKSLNISLDNAIKTLQKTLKSP